MIKFKNLILCTVIISIAITNISFGDMKLVYDGVEHNYTADSIVLIVNGKRINPDMPPVIIDGRTLVPARAVFEQVGANVLWVADTQEIFIALDNDILNLKIDDNRAIINQDVQLMEVPPKIINDSTMIPLRFVAEALNFEVDWDSKNRIASITSKPKQVESTKPTESQSTVEQSTSNNYIPTVPTVPPSQSTIDTQTPIDTPVMGSNGEIVRFKPDIPYYDNTVVSNITSENHGIAEIYGVEFPKNGDEIFKIKANGKISYVTYGTLENPIRLYVDIQNSISKLDSEITSSGSNITDTVRTSQQLNNITRIVFDIPNGQNYNIYLSDDRTVLNVQFKPIIINEVTFQSTLNQDIINIYANAAFSPSINQLYNPYSMVIDIPNSVSNIGNSAANIAGTNVTSIRTSQPNNSTFRIVLNMSTHSNYDITSNNICTTIKISVPTYKNMNYDNSGYPKLILKKDSNYNLDINSFKHEDGYLDGYYKITIPTNVSNLYGSGQYSINDSYLESITINNNSNTEIVFNQKNIYAYTVTEDSQNIYINILNPKQVYKKIVFIDAGHGGNAPGTIQNGVTEKIVTLDVSNRLYILLENDPDIKVYATRTTDVDMERPKRAALASNSSDMFVSMHCNSLESNTNASGIQMFYPNPVDSRGKLSQNIATVIGEAASRQSGLSLRAADQTIGYDLTVLQQTTIPACLIEMGFLTNVNDAKFLASPEGRQSMAQGIYNGIKKCFDTTVPSR